MLRKMDFLLVGFVKSGTTTLDNILRQDRRIYLPQGVKETHFFDWSDKENALELFWSMYYPRIQKNKFVGGIEPCYIRNAKQVYDTFGKNLKLLFMMRNPIEADYSLFKMGLKWGGTHQLTYFYKKYRSNQIAKMYHQYTIFRLKHSDSEELIQDEFRYEKWINEYLQYFDASQIKFILFEDFIENPEHIAREVEDFIGIKGRVLNTNVCSNEGGKISRNYFCARLNYELSHKRKQQEYKNVEKRKKIGAIQEALFKVTLVENREKMLEDTEKILKQYYNPAKEYIEILLNRNLSDVWFDV